MVHPAARRSNNVAFIREFTDEAQGDGRGCAVRSSGARNASRVSWPGLHIGGGRIFTIGTGIRGSKAGRQAGRQEQQTKTLCICIVGEENGGIHKFSAGQILSHLVT